MEHLSLITKRGGGQGGRKVLKTILFWGASGVARGFASLGRVSIVASGSTLPGRIVFFDFLVFGIQPRIRPICVRTILAFEPVCDDLLDSKFVRSYKEPTERAEIST